MNKEVLRKVFLEKRLTLSTREWERRSQLLEDLFFNNIDLSSIQILHVYLPIEDRKEPQMWNLLGRLKEEYPEVKVCVSKTIWKDHSLVHYLLEGPDQLKLSKYGIPEPTTGIQIADKDIDMVLIPLISFDRKGNRIGYGGGFYDRFLEKLPKQCKKIGFTIATSLDYIPYNENFDIPMDACLSPLGFIEFSSKSNS